MSWRHIYDAALGCRSAPHCRVAGSPLPTDHPRLLGQALASNEVRSRSLLGVRRLISSAVRPTRPGGWGWFLLNGATVAVGVGWGDTDAVMEDRGLKHRARTATRRVPVPPPLCELIDAHLDTFGAGPDGRLFVPRRGPGGRLIPGRPRPVPNNTHTAVWQRARRLALPLAEQRSMLARRPYDLRHAAVSTWLNAGVPAPQVAEWAGHSVHVLMKVYAKCVYDQEEAARRRIEGALVGDAHGEGAENGR